ncbi:MAG TPA: hypothetical protein DD490_22820, partial [Acidobacteria bacterium]|nr:hypothetical protein [Acidobacteriota bacterium]
TVERLAGGFGRLLASAGEAPGRRLSELDLLSAAERHQVGCEWSDRPAAGAGWAPEGTTAAHLFAAQALRTPQETALVCSEETLTYAELH